MSKTIRLVASSISTHTYQNYPTQNERARARTHARAHTHAHAHTHTDTHTHTPKQQCNMSYLMILEASSASGSAQYLLARIKQASADSI
jgi:DNA gyrase/topoisomerase IV subunit B